MGKHDNHSRREDLAGEHKVTAVSQVLHTRSDYEK
jgi:hypothetical protein